MNKITRFLFLFGIIGILSFSCEKEKIETDPTKAILGKWEIIELGNWPDMESVPEATGYKEYLSDSILREFDYETQSFTFYKKYWIDSLLHVSITREDGFQLVFEYKYLFDDNKLRLDNANVIALFNTSIYKRLN
jgi:hypothetical protein